MGFVFLEAGGIRHARPKPRFVLACGVLLAQRLRCITHDVKLFYNGHLLSVLQRLSLRCCCCRRQALHLLEFVACLAGQARALRCVHANINTPVAFTGCPNAGLYMALTWHSWRPRRISVCMRCCTGQGIAKSSSKPLMIVNQAAQDSCVTPPCMAVIHHMQQPAATNSCGQNVLNNEAAGEPLPVGIAATQVHACSEQPQYEVAFE